MLVILGVVSAPTVVSCFSSADGFGQCVNNKLADIGLLPKAPPPAETVADVAPADAASEAVATEEPAEELTPPALDVAPPAERETAPDGLVAATFGLLRAEPDGSVVIAGSGAPGSEVEVYADDTLLGSTTVERSGDWVFVPEQPLPAGGVEITLAEAGKEGRAERSFVVVIDEDKTTQPLVVASVPGQASEVLQGLERRAIVTAPAATEVAAAPAETAPNNAAAVPVAQPETQVTAETEAAPAQAPATEAPLAVADATPSASAPEPQRAAPEPAVTTPEATATQPAAAVATAHTEEPDPADEPAQVAAVEPAETTEPASPAETPEVVAVPEPAEVEPAPAVASAPPTIDAIEIEGNRTFFAGSAPERGTVRLYVDDAFVADSVVDGGRWLVEAGPVLSKPSQRVRADLLAPGSSTVVARAEVDFLVDMPEAAPAETAVASAEVRAATAPAVPAQQAAPMAAADTPSAPEAVRAPAAPAAPTQAEPVQAAQAETAEASPAEAPAVPRMVAVSIGGPDAQRFASGKAIIRRGDNLWTIARRVYGEGIKYTTIYEANTGQIRDPNRIYPGQVFGLPR